MFLHNFHPLTLIPWVKGDAKHCYSGWYDRVELFLLTKILNREREGERRRESLLTSQAKQDLTMKLSLLSVSLYLCVSVSLFLCFSLSLFLFISLSLCLCVSVSLCLCVSVSLSLCLCRAHGSKSSRSQGVLVICRWVIKLNSRF